MAFVLTVTDNTETINFVGTTFKAADGGFDIGMPQSVKTLSEIRPGFFKLASKRNKYRTATITFAIHGATRSAVLTSLAQLERVINNIEQQEWLTDITRGQLAYQFDGATQVTYFEIYAGDITMPTDLLSVKQAHAVDLDGYYVQDITLKLYLSPVGYGLSIFSQPGASQAIPLNNPSQGTKTTNWIEVGNIANASGVENYVEIVGTDVPGGQPYITSIQAYVSSAYDNLTQIYIGKTLEPFPTASHLVYSCEPTSTFGQGSDSIAVGWSQVAQANSLDGYYRQYTNSAGYTYGDFEFSRFAWYIPSTMTSGMYLPFAVGYGDMLNRGGSFALSLGYQNYDNWGVYNVPEPQGYDGDSGNHHRLSPLLLPPTNPTILDYGTSLNTDLMLAYYVAITSSATDFTTNFEYVHLLPINHGLRVWRIRRPPNETATSIMVDNTFNGIHYNSASGVLHQGFNPSMTPITLTPNVDQRLYFNSRGVDSASGRERNRMMMVKVFGVPTFETLAY